MNENDKILINAYLDDELSGDEIKYIESLINSDDDANDYANKIKNANHEINSFFKSSEFDELEEGVDTFINIQLNKTKRLRNIFNIRIPRVNQKYFGFAASAMLIVIILIPNFNNEEYQNPDEGPEFQLSPLEEALKNTILTPTSVNYDLINPVYKISSERSDGSFNNFEKILKEVVVQYGDMSIFVFKIESDKFSMMVKINEFKDNCYLGTVSSEDGLGKKDFKICKE